MAAAIGWTQDEISLLIQLWKEGSIATEIGDRLGRTKNAVIGKAHRLELERRPHFIKGFHKKTMMELKPKDCRFPLGERLEPAFRYCGKKIQPGSVYCTDHHSLCYIKRERKPRP